MMTGSVEGTDVPESVGKNPYQYFVGLVPVRNYLQHQAIQGSRIFVVQILPGHRVSGYQAGYQ